MPVLPLTITLGRPSHGELLSLAGAPFSVDGQARGTTPATADVTPGQHNVEITAQDAVDETRIIDVDVSGATLVDATFLADGRLALQVALPDGARPGDAFKTIFENAEGLEVRVTPADGSPSLDAFLVGGYG